MIKVKTKRFFSAISAFLLLLVLVSCGSSTDSAAENNVDIAKLFDAMCAADTNLPEMTKISGSDENADLNFTSLCDFDYELVKNYIYAYATDGTAPEVAVVELKDASDAGELMNKLNAHAKLRKGTMEAYSPEQVELVEKYILVRSGNLVAYVVSPQNGLVQEVFQNWKEG